MANHASSLKRVRSDAVKRDRNRYYHKTMRNAVRALRNSEDKKEVEEKMPKVISLIDRLAKRNVIHKNKANNLKGSLAQHLNDLK
jgi:small subunit ribosomal protein S20